MDAYSLMQTNLNITFIQWNYGNYFNPPPLKSRYTKMIYITEFSLCGNFGTDLHPVERLKDLDFSTRISCDSETMLRFGRAFSSSSLRAGRTLTIDKINPLVRDAQYAVRGELVLKSMEYDALLASGQGAHLPFNKTIACNIGNPQALKQKPITFHRQVLSLVNYPDALDNPAIVGAYPADAVARARAIVEGLPAGIGAYSESKGVAMLRASVARFIEERLADPDQ